MNDSNHVIEGGLSYNMDNSVLCLWKQQAQHLLQSLQFVFFVVVLMVLLLLFYRLHAGLITGLYATQPSQSQM